MADHAGRRCGEEGYEWSIPVHEGFDPGKPARFFVRAEPGDLIELCEAPVTSFSPFARELKDPRTKRIYLSSEMAEFLIAVLPQALKLKEKEDDDG